MQPTAGGGDKLKTVQTLMLANKRNNIDAGLGLPQTVIN